MEKFAEMFFKSRNIQRNAFLELGCPTTFSARIVEDAGDTFCDIHVRSYLNICTYFQKIIIKSRESFRRLQVNLQQSEIVDA